MGSPAFSDQRQQDVAAVRAALDGVAVGKMAELPVMSSAELCALGALSHPVLDAPALAWWTSQADKEKLARLAYAVMGRRKLLDPDTGRVSPPLGLILAGRSRPAFVLLTRDKPAAEPRAIRLYGIADESGTRAVLAERTQPNPGAWTGPVYRFMLTGVESEAAALAEWAAGGRHRTLDLYRPASGTTDPSERLVVTPARHHQLSVDRQTPGAQPPETLACDQQGLASLMAGIMTGVTW
jgi:hypothetical protein